MLRPAKSPWANPRFGVLIASLLRYFFTSFLLAGCLKSANRGHYRNARIDALTNQIHVEMDQERRKALCSEVQKILAEDLPYLPLWFSVVVSVHRRFTTSGSREGSGDLPLSPTGDFDFLATLVPRH